MLQRGRVRRAWGVAGVLCIEGLCAATCCGAQTSELQQQDQSVVVRELKRGDPIGLQVAGPAMGSASSTCGPDGSIYLEYSPSMPTIRMISNGVVSQMAVSKISLEPARVREYQVPGKIEDFEGHVYRTGYAVNGDGTLYALFNTARREPDGKMKAVDFIGKYNDDGTVDSYVEVDTQADGMRLQPFQIAVFGNGNFLLTGTTVVERKLGTFTGLFSDRGELVKILWQMKPVALPRYEAPSAKDAVHKPVSHAKMMQDFAKSPVSLASSTLSFSGLDGNVYVLQGVQQAKLRVVTPWGEILHQYDVKPPEPDLSPLQMAQAGPGYLFIYYSYISTGARGDTHPPANMITVLNAETGEVTGTYRLSKKYVFDSPKCATSAHRFIFLGKSEKNEMEIVPYRTP